MKFKQILVIKENLEPLIGCVLTKIYEGVDNNGFECVVLEFIEPLKRTRKRLQIEDYSILHIGEEETQ